MDKLIEKARELANDVKERTVAAARNVAERLESFFGTGKQGLAAESEVSKKHEQAPSPLHDNASLDKLLAELDNKLAMQDTMDAQLAQLDRRMEMDAQREAERSKQQELERSKSRSKEKDQGHSL